MATFTIEKQISLKKTHFRDMEELRDFLDVELSKDFDIDFRQLKKHEITPEIREKAQKVRGLPPSRFVNLSSLDVNN